MPNHGTAFEPKSMAGLQHAEGELRILPLEISLVEAPDRRKHLAIEDVEGREEVDLLRHRPMTDHDLLVDETFEERGLGSDPVGSTDATDLGIVEMGQQSLQGVGCGDAVGVHEPDQRRGRDLDAEIAGGSGTRPVPDSTSTPRDSAMARVSSVEPSSTRMMPRA